MIAAMPHEVHTGDAHRAPKVYIVILNWNNGTDTIECLESVYRLDYPDFEVVLCDNASTDESMALVERWARGDVEPSSTSARRGSPIPHAAPVPKPIVIHDPRWEHAVENDVERSSLTLIRLPDNGGFARGNNAGLAYAQRRGDAQFVWLLNNDTVVDEKALSALVNRACADPRIGICGSLLLFYDRPDRVQAAGGAVYHRATATVTTIAHDASPQTLPAPEVVEARIDYIVGASMLVSRGFLDAVGLMREDYFLYYEEVDWVLRAGRRFKLAFAPGSIVFHKEGASAGSSSNWRTRSEISDLCALRNRLLITRRFYKAYYPIVFASIVAAFFRRLLRRQPDRARHILRMLLNPESYRLPLPDGSFLTVARSK